MSSIEIIQRSDQRVASPRSLEPFISIPTNVQPIEMVQRSEQRLVFLETAEPLISTPTSVQPIQDIIPVISWVYPAPQDPFSLSFSEYSRLNYMAALELQDAVYRASSQDIEGAWKRGKIQVVICNGKIVYETESLEDIPNDKIMELAKKYDKACYVFSNSDMIEESAWTPIDEEDDYPTIGIYCGAVDSEESEIVKNSPLINADFDTGNPGYKIFDANILHESIASFLPPLRQARHLGRYYPYFLKTVKLCVKDSDGKIHSIVRDIRLVRDWIGSALLQVSPNRVGFVGRDLLRDFRIKIELDPTQKASKIYGASF